MRVSINDHGNRLIRHRSELFENGIALCGYFGINHHDTGIGNVEGCVAAHTSGRSCP